MSSSSSPFGPMVTRKKPPPPSSRPADDTLTTANTTSSGSGGASQSPFTAEKVGSVAPNKTQEASLAPTRSWAAQRFERPSSFTTQSAPGSVQRNASIIKVQRWVRSAVSSRKASQLMLQESVQIIQSEYRDYLQRTQTTRRLLRQKRESDRQFFRAAVFALCKGEADDRERLLGQAVDAWQALEEDFLVHLWKVLHSQLDRERRKIIGAEESERRDLVREVCPPWLNPDAAVEHSEFVQRNILVRRRAEELKMLLGCHLARAAADARTQQQAQREHIWLCEAREWNALLVESFHDMFAARLEELQRVEHELRLVFAESRQQYMNTGLKQQFVASLRTILMASTNVPEAEPYQRHAIVLEEERASRRLWVLFHDALFVAKRCTVVEEERVSRHGRWGILAAEAAERTAIDRAIFAMKLQLLQRADIEDVTCEAGSRAAIQWEEQRLRHDIITRCSRRTSAAVLTELERATRIGILRTERDARSQIFEHITPLLRLLSAFEQGRRRLLFEEWCEDFRRLALRFACLRLEAVEERRRRQLMRLGEFMVDHYVTWNYIHCSQLRERHVLLRRFAQSTAALCGSRRS